MTAVASVLVVCGAALVYWSWERRKRHHGVHLAGGWALLLAGLAMWGRRFADSGVAIGTALFVAAAFAILAVCAWRAIADGKDTQSRTPSAARSRTAARSQIANLAFAAFGVLVSGAIALACAVAMMRLVRTLGSGEANAIVTAYAAAPIFWAIIAAGAVMASTAKTRIVFLAAMALTPSAYLVFSS